MLKNNIANWSNQRYVKVLVAALIFRLVIAGGLYGFAMYTEPQSSNAWLSRVLKGPDAISYHRQAVKLKSYWLNGTGGQTNEQKENVHGYSVILAVIYSFAGENPFAGIILNCLAFFVASLLARRMALSLGANENASLLSALLVALWPPSFLYSSILLKDSLFIFAVLAFLTPLMEVASQVGKKDSQPNIGGYLFKLVVFSLGILLMMNLRGYYDQLLMVVGLFAIGLGLLLTLYRLDMRSLPACLVMGLMVVALTGNMPEDILGKPATHITREERAVAAKPAKPAKPEKVRAGKKRASKKKKQVQNTARLMLQSQLDDIYNMRRRFTKAGGVSLDERAYEIPGNGLPSVGLLMHGLRNLFLFPYPWQQWPLGYEARNLAFFGALQSVYWYLLLPGLIVGLFVALRRAFAPALILLLWVGLVGILFSLVETNLGTLYRHRDMVLLPALAFLHAPLYGLLFGKQWKRLFKEPDHARHKV
jgi:hypothetical protein